MKQISTITYKIYDSIMNILSRLLFGPNDKFTNIFDLEWDHLIILDACRFDMFSKVYDIFFDPNKIVKFEKIISPASSTMEFVKKYFSSKTIIEKAKNIIFINSNPVIDNTLHKMGLNPKDIFYKYIPVWKKYWDSNVGSVRPEDVYRIALKAHIQYPNKKMIIWFLQPHYPYLDDERFEHLNRIERDFMNKSLNVDSDNNFIIFFGILKRIFTKGYISAGIPDSLSEHMRRNLKEVQKAYLSNLILVLKYVKKLTEHLSGTIIITSDHGEAFGERLTKLLPVKVYGHPSRVRIPSLVEVPYLETKFIKKVTYYE